MLQKASLFQRIQKSKQRDMCYNIKITVSRALLLRIEIYISQLVLTKNSLLSPIVMLNSEKMQMQNSQARYVYKILLNSVKS